MDSLSQAEVGSALQVYFNLGTLKQVRALPTTHMHVPVHPIVVHACYYTRTAHGRALGP